MHVLKIPTEVFRTVATTTPRPRPRHRDPWSPAECRNERGQRAPRGRHLARPTGWAVIAVQR